MGSFPRPGQTFGAYTVHDLIGQGAMGAVFSARQHGLDRRVAFKVIAPHLARHDGYRERFAREAAALARLDSPHIVHIYDHGEVEGCPYLATQLVDGGDLGDLLRTRGPLDPSPAVQIAAQVADALADAHAAGVIHRDVKPSNILLRGDTREPHAYLCDFGIAQLEADAAEDRTRPEGSGGGAVPGTVAYLAPERCRGEVATPASDLYALGCVLHALLTGHAPYRGSDVEVGHQHLEAPVPDLRAHLAGHHDLAVLVTRLLAKDPGERGNGAGAVRDELRTLQGVDARPAWGRRPRRAALTLIAAGAVCAAGLVLGTMIVPPQAEPLDRGAASALGSGGEEYGSASFGSTSGARPADGPVVRGDSYSFRVPRGWREVDVAGIEVFWVQVRDDPAFAHNVNAVSEPVAAATTLDDVAVTLGRTAEQLGATAIDHAGPVTIDGVDFVQQSATLIAGAPESIGTPVSYRVHQFATVRDGSVLTLTISQGGDTPEADSRAEIAAILATFRWRR